MPATCPSGCISQRSILHVESLLHLSLRSYQYCAPVVIWHIVDTSNQYFQLDEQIVNRREETQAS